MMAEAEQGQDLPTESSDETSFAVEGVQLNEASRPVTIYHRETGEPRKMPKIAATVALRKKYKIPGDPLNGTFIFSPTPTKKFHWGETKCTLHPDNPEREEYDAWGLPVCTSEHLASPGEVVRHMQMRHPSANNVIKVQQEKRDRERDLQAQAATAESVRDALLVMAGKAPVEAPTEPDTADSNTETANVTTTTVDLLGHAATTDEAGLTFAWTCPKCHEVLTAETERKLIGQRGGHTRSKHPKKRRTAR
ncbi:MAG: hypothetical protein IIA44_02175 [Acidobacteria bacterium]|nr:hypothetical protein [Acidobacteriota bacterium]